MCNTIERLYRCFKEANDNTMCNTIERLYRCFKEANDNTMCNTIERAQVFSDKVNRLGHTILTGHDIECVSLFLTWSFNKDWEGLNLWNRYIQDKGLNILYHGLHHTSDITINKLWLDHNA